MLDKLAFSGRSSHATAARLATNAQINGYILALTVPQIASAAIYIEAR